MVGAAALAPFLAMLCISVGPQGIYNILTSSEATSFLVICGLVKYKISILLL